MTDKTDTRLDALTSALKVQWGKGWMNDDGQDPADVLSDLDAADRAAGVVRVDTNDEALAERIARAVIEQAPIVSVYGWDEMRPEHRQRWMDAIRAALQEAAR